jgi:hypothetical protein
MAQRKPSGSWQAVVTYVVLLVIGLVIRLAAPKDSILGPIGVAVALAGAILTIIELYRLARSKDSARVE